MFLPGSILRLGTLVFRFGIFDLFLFAGVYFVLLNNMCNLRPLSTAVFLILSTPVGEWGKTKRMRQRGLRQDSVKERQVDIERRPVDFAKLSSSWKNNNNSTSRGNSRGNSQTECGPIVAVGVVRASIGRNRRRSHHTVAWYSLPASASPLSASSSRFFVVAYFFSFCYRCGCSVQPREHDLSLKYYY